MSVIRCTVQRHGWWTERTHRATAERSWRAKVYAGTDPLTGREIRFRKTCKTGRAAQIELGKLLAMAQAGRQPDSDVTVAQLLDQYVSTAGWDVSTRESNLGYGPPRESWRLQSLERMESCQRPRGIPGSCVIGR